LIRRTLSVPRRADTEIAALRPILIEVLLTSGHPFVLGGIIMLRSSGLSLASRRARRALTMTSSSPPLAWPMAERRDVNRAPSQPGTFAAGPYWAGLTEAPSAQDMAALSCLRRSASPVPAPARRWQVCPGYNDGGPCGVNRLLLCHNYISDVALVGWGCRDSPRGCLH